MKGKMLNQVNYSKDLGVVLTSDRMCVMENKSRAFHVKSVLMDVVKRA